MSRSVLVAGPQKPRYTLCVASRRGAVLAGNDAADLGANFDVWQECISHVQAPQSVTKIKEMGEAVGGVELTVGGTFGQ